MNPVWITVLIAAGSAIVGSAVTGAIWFGALRYWMGKREVNEDTIKDHLEDHEERLRAIERGPLDYAR